VIITILHPAIRTTSMKGDPVEKYMTCQNNHNYIELYTDQSRVKLTVIEPSIKKFTR